MSQAAIETLSITRHTPDSRADGGTRVVHVSANQIVIERVLQNVRMKVAVPVAAYTGLVLAVRPQSATAILHLRHKDKDLDVALDAGGAMEVARRAKAWGALFGKPVSIEEASILIAQPFARHRMTAPKRSRLADRRVAGDTARLETKFLGEREIIARN